jgi:anti-sigma B factor antagonist
MTGAKSWLHVDEAKTAPNGMRLLHISGELDLGTIGTLQAAVDERIASGTRILLDLEGLRFCDSTGLGAIIKLHRRLDDLAGVLVLCAPGQRVLDVLSISGVDQVINVYPSVAAAVKALAAPA